jgi:hypothetical protein
MIFKQVSNTDPERVLLAVTNSYSTSALNDGDWVGWDIVTDKNGHAVTKATGAIRSVVAGCATQYIASGAIGLIQVWGYKSNAKVKGGSGSLTAKLTAGQNLVMATGNLAIQAHARNSAAAKSAWGHRTFGVFVEPLNTGAKGLSATTSRGEVMIYCL